MADQQQASVRLPREFRERRDVLNELSGTEPIRRCRLDRAGIEFVTDLVRPVLLRPTGTNKALPPDKNIIITLQFTATGKIQLYNAGDSGCRNRR